MVVESSRPQTVLVIVAQGTYTNWEQLTQVPGLARKLATALDGNGYRLRLPELLEGGTVAGVRDALGPFLKELSEHDRLMLYWIGHGSGSGIHYLVVKDSPKPADAWMAIPTRDLGILIAQSKVEKVLVVLDTCFSSGGAEGFARDIYEVLNTKTDLPGQIRFAGVLPSVNALEKAQEGVFCRALEKVLTDPSVPSRRWTDQDEQIGFSNLGVALLEVLGHEFGEGWQPPRPFTLGFDDRFLPNPRYRGPQPAMDVETRRMHVPEALALAAGGVEAGVIGSYFKGRTRVLSELVHWLREGSGVLILTGPPGSGKSAVLGRLATLCNPAHRQISEGGGDAGATHESTLPVVAIDAALHAKGLAVGECARRIAEQAGIEPPAGVSFDTARFLDSVRELGRPPTVLVDALDEAVHPLEVGEVLLRLSTEAGGRVLVGTRRSPDGRPLQEGVDRHSRLRFVFGKQARIVDLDDEPDTAADIAAYVTARLKDDPRSRHRDDAEAIERVAQGVAERAQGVFLYARVVSRTLQEAAVLDARNLPVGPLEAFADDLNTRFKDTKEVVVGLLTALAWGEGGGLSRWAWPRVATALSTAGESYDEAQVASVLDHAGFHILEAAESGQTVYRLAHQSFTELYRRQSADVVGVQQAITKALTEKPLDGAVPARDRNNA